ncbi:MAG: Holliday junction resolvase RuvX [Chlamydiota bacterium]
MPQRIVGVDYGKARIGIALSDESQMLASAFKTITAEKDLGLTASKFLTALQDIPCEIGKIVVGLPLQMNGQQGTMADEVQKFIDLLREKSAIPIIAWDERLTTLQATRSMKEGKMSRKKRSKVIDVMSAVIILQSFLDSSISMA